MSCCGIKYLSRSDYQMGIRAGMIAAMLGFAVVKNMSTKLSQRFGDEDF